MAIDRRMVVLGAGASALLALAPTTASAQVPDRYVKLMRKLMARGWSGKSRVDAPGIEGGEFITDLSMRFELGSDWSFTGSQVESFTLDGKFYRGESSIWGNCWVIEDKASLAIRGMRPLNGTPLPSPLFWSSSKGEMRFFNDGDREGRFILKGALTDVNDGTLSRVEMYDVD